MTPYPNVSRRFRVRAYSRGIFTGRAHFNNFNGNATRVGYHFSVFTARRSMTAMDFRHGHKSRRAFRRRIQRLLRRRTIFVNTQLRFVNVARRMASIRKFIFQRRTPFRTDQRTHTTTPFRADIFCLVGSFIQERPNRHLAHTFMAIFTTMFIRPR